MAKVAKKKSTNHNRSMKSVRSCEWITYVDKEVIVGCYRNFIISLIAGYFIST